MKSLYLNLTLAIALLSTGSAQVQEITLGVDINCRSGLSECYVLVGKGLARLESVQAIGEKPSNASRTCVIETRDGRLLGPLTLAEQLRSLQIGARLRAMEASVIGQVELDGIELVLRLPGEPGTIPLTPLTQKVHWDEKHDQPERITPRERKAYSSLRERAKMGGLPVRVTGPLRQSNREAPLHMEVRDFEVYPEFQPGPLTLVARLRIESRRVGAGAAEPLGSLQEHLRRLNWVESVEAGSSSSAPSLVLQLRPAHFPDLAEFHRALAQHAPRTHVTRLELQGSSLCYDRAGTIVIKARGSPAGYHELEMMRSRSGADLALLQTEIAQGGPAPIRWSGLLRKSFTGRWRLAIESWGPAPENPEAGFAASARPSPPLLQAGSPDGRTIQFEWFNIDSADPRGYNIYRRLATGRWEKLNDQLLIGTTWRTEAPLEEYYAATALSAPEVESTYSKLVSPSAPAGPRKLKLQNQGGAPQITWSPNNEPDFSSYNIYRSTIPSGPYIQISAGVTETTYSDPFAGGKSFYYVITATDSSGNESVFSEEVRYQPAGRVANKSP